MYLPDPALRDKQPWKAAYAQDYAWLGEVISRHYRGDDSDVKVLIGGLLKAFAGMPVEVYQTKDAAFMQRAQHPIRKRALRDCGYAPMVELLRYLEDYGFVNYIASCGDRDFVRVVAEGLRVTGA